MLFMSIRLEALGKREHKPQRLDRAALCVRGYSNKDF